MLYGIQRLAELNPKSSGTRGIGGELPPHGWNRSEQEDNRGAAAQAASQPLSLAPACASPRVVLVTAVSWGFETSPCVATCGWNPLLLSPESCLRGQTRTEVGASLQVTHRGWRETSVGMHKASSVLAVWEWGKRGPFFLCCIAPRLFSACWNIPFISESVTASCLRQSSKSHRRQREGPRFWLNPKPDRSYYPFCLLFKYAWIIIDFNIRYWKICKFQ